MIDTMSSLGLLPKIQLHPTFNRSVELRELWGENGLSMPETLLLRPTLPQELEENLAGARERVNSVQEEFKGREEANTQRIVTELPPERAALALDRPPACTACGRHQGHAHGTSVSRCDMN